MQKVNYYHYYCDYSSVNSVLITVCEETYSNKTFVRNEAEISNWCSVGYSL